MTTLSNSQVTPEVNTEPEDARERVVQALIELNPIEPFSASRIAVQAGLSPREALFELVRLSMDPEGVLNECWLYRNEAGKFEVYDATEAMDKVLSKELDSARLFARFEVNERFRSMVPQA